MKPFVDIVSVFTDNADRVVDQLELLYDDSQYLKETIGNLIDKWLSAEDIAGKRILLKPNWVRHSIKEEDAICLRTHDSFLLAALEIILIKKPASVVIGDAPIQGADWDAIAPEPLVTTIKVLSQRFKIPVWIKDFRRTIFTPSANRPQIDRSSLDEYLIFDLGHESYLEPVSLVAPNPFRVTCYNPDRLAESHGPGVHKYCITKELFNADVVISLPKIKTHQKAGMTGALKNLVGLNGDKDYLPHHRIGGTKVGGDCYPGGNYLRYWAELAMDQANRHQGAWAYKLWQKLSSLLWRLTFPGAVHQMAAGWYGNDTTWRMVLDLNKIAMYGNAEGKMCSTPQRTIYSLCDGIIGGQGNGPLDPDPLPLGLVSFSNHPYMTDICMAVLMGFDIQKIPLLASAQELSNQQEVSLYLDNKPITLNTLNNFSIKTVPPAGWAEYLASS